MAQIALRSAKDSLLSFINEVEMKEKSVEKAREEAAHGGLDTLARVEDLKKMLQRAKEANDMVAYLPNMNVIVLNTLIIRARCLIFSPFLLIFCGCSMLVKYMVKKLFYPLK